MVPDYAFSAALSTTDDFDPCPPWFFYIGTGFLLTSGIFPLGLLCIWCKSPKGMNTAYKTLYTLMIFYSFCMHLTACSSLPVFIFPYRIAVITTGIATSFGPSTNFLFSLLFMFGCSIPCTNASLFYYRTDALLPPDHRWNKKCIRRTFYSLILTTYVPIFFILYVEGSTDQELQKRGAFQSLGYVTKYLWDARTVIYNISLDHSFIYILVGSIVIFLGFPSFMTIGLFFNYVYILTRFNKNASKRTARLHSILFVTLVAQITVYGLLFVGPIVFFLVCVYFNLVIIQLATSVFAMSPVGGVFTMIAVNQHYRRYLIQLFFKEKNEQAVNQGIFKKLEKMLVKQLTKINSGCLKWTFHELIMCGYAILFIVTFCIMIPKILVQNIQERTNDSQQDYIITRKLIKFYLNGNETIKIDGTQMRSQSEYQLTLPSYNMSWPERYGGFNPKEIQEIFFKIRIGESQTIVKTKADIQDCPELPGRSDHTKKWWIWCLTVASSQPIEEPIVVDYHVIYTPDDLTTPSVLATCLMAALLYSPLSPPDIQNVERKDLGIIEKVQNAAVKRIKRICPNFPRMTMNDITNFAFLAVMFLGFPYVMITLLVRSIQENRVDALQDLVISQKGIKLYLNGAEAFKINGTQGNTEYTATLPSYNISWPDKRDGLPYSGCEIQDLFIKIHIGDNKVLLKSKEDLQACPGMEENADETKKWWFWCLKVASTRPLEQPIVVDYHLMYSSENVVSFHRTFIVENWTA